MRYTLIDYMHLTHRTRAVEPLRATVDIGGILQDVDTTIPNYTIKNVYNYSGRGANRVGVFLEGGHDRRKKYFENQAVTTQSQSGYKGDRKKQTNLFYQGVNLAVNLMHQGGVTLYRQTGLEADDCIGNVVKAIKAVDTDTPIDIITNDSDLLPYVDEQVSVYMRGTRGFAEEGCPEYRLYFQVTPRTWDEFLEYSSAFKKFRIPYNSMLLHKLIRGDKTDGIAASTTGMGGVKYTSLMYEMERDGVDFPNVFRYHVDFDEVIRPVLSKYTDYFNEDIIEYMKYIFNGIKPPELDLILPRQINPAVLQKAVQAVKINIL